MTDVNATKQSEAILKAYAEDHEGLTDQECAAVGFSALQCKVLVGVLDWGVEGEIAAVERVALEQVGFSKKFVDEVAGVDGKKALQQRANWFADHCITKPWRGDFEAALRASMIDELKTMNELFQNRADPTYQRVVSSLQEGLEDEDKTVRDKAAWALAAWGAAGPILDEVLMAMDRSEPRDEGSFRGGSVYQRYLQQFRYETTKLILQLGPSRAEWALKAWDEIEDSSLHLQFDILEALGDMNSLEVSPFLSQLEMIDKTVVSESYTHALVHRVLVLIGVPAVPFFIEELKSEMVSRRQRAADALGEIGSAEGVPALVAAMRDEEAKVVVTVADSLENIIEASDDGRLAFIPYLRDFDQMVAGKVDDCNVDCQNAAGRVLQKLEEEMR